MILSPTFFLMPAIVLFGAFTIVTQVVFFREFLVVAGGNELVIGIIFWCWFTGVGIGAWIASYRGRGSGSLSSVAACLLTQAFAAPVLLFVIRALRLVWGTPVGQAFPLLPLSVSAMAVTLPFCGLTGYVFPRMCALIQPKTEKPGASIGVVYYLESFGSIAGGLGFSFFFVTLWNSFFILILFSLLTGALCFLLTRNAHARPRSALNRLSAGLCAILLAALIANGDAYLHRASTELRWKSISPGMPLIKSADTKFQHLSLGVLEGQYSLFSNGTHVSDFPDDYDDAREAFFILSERPSPDRVLILGGGDEGVLKFLLRASPGRVDYVDYDKKLLPFIRDELSNDPGMAAALSHPAVHIIAMDGRRYVREKALRYEAREYGIAPEFYDLVILNLPDPSTAMLNRFYTVEFFRDLRAIVSARGVVTCSLSSAVNYFGEDVSNYLGSVYRSLRQVFPHVAATPGTSARLFASPSDGVVTDDPKVLAARYQRMGIESDMFSPLIFVSLFPAQKTALTKAALEKAAVSVPLNTDLRPVAYVYNLVVWGTMSGSHIQGAVRQILKLSMGKVMMGIGLLLLVRFIFLSVRKPSPKERARFAVLYLIVVSGFAGMSAEIILIFLFQSIYGYVYRQIGLIVACFMAGLTLGAFLSTKIKAEGARSLFGRLASIEAGFTSFFLALALVVPSLAEMGSAVWLWKGVEIMFFAGVALTGVCAGVEFPLVGRALLVLEGGVVKSAGFVDAADHFGAAAGALACGVALAPVLGIQNALLVVFALKVMGLVFLFDFRSAEK